MSGAGFDCQACGACCVEAGAITVSPADATPRYLTRSVRGRIGFASWEASDGVRQMDKHLGGRCKALRSTVGAACSCGTYARRPAVCRDFAPGSDLCLLSREAMANKLAHPERRPRGYGKDWQATVRGPSSAAADHPHTTTGEHA